MSWEQIVVNLGGGGAVAGALAYAMRSPRLRKIALRLLSSDFNVKDALESLKGVVEAQGESIEWLRTELDRTREELSDARSRLQETANLALENAKLRVRVSELEGHVARLEEELNRRKGGRPRKEISDL
jgi:hypothetical protein